jgi:nitrate/TMAO reductase-like tetraheme cytochrome c subunit
MREQLKRLRKFSSYFITPDRTAPRWVRLLPYGTLIVAGLLIFLLGGAGWEYTNSSEFCGTACHTMPPEYAAYQISPHARINCVECHIGRGFIATQFTRKAGDLSHVVRYVGADYEVPIYVKNLRPATQVCERCHSPEKFSDDSLREYRRYDAAQNNALSATFLAFKTGGGTLREGRGKGIHWHIENKVEYIATDDPRLEQEIPWVRVTFAGSGEVNEYTDIEANLPADFVAQNQENIKIVDCMTCHNRISHLFRSPSDALDDAMARGVISPAIPYFKQNAVTVMERKYPIMDEARQAIAGLKDYYAVNWSSYYNTHTETVDTAVQDLLAIYERMVFPTMDVSWNTHPNNLGHREWPGCFRCHDGKHLNEKQESIRIECNLCHSIPLRSRPDGTIPSLPVQELFEPESHIDTNWVSRHRFEFDNTCEGCHDVSNPGGSDDSSYCANSGCHATEWKFAGLNAPGIIELTNVLDESLPVYPQADLTWTVLVGPILQARCVACHGGTAGLYLDTYEGVLAGGNFGPAITPGNARESLLVKLQQTGHPNSLAPRELEWIGQWIDAGSPR